MKNWLMRFQIVFALIAGVGFFAGCSSSVSPEMNAKIESHAKLYTQVGMWYDLKKNGLKLVEGTNYSVGTFIPVNSEVTFEEIAKEGVIFNYKGEKIYIRNVAKYTKLETEAFLNRTFAAVPADLSTLSGAEKASVAKGEIKPGMSRAAVILGRGYPPAHATPSLENNRWRYWKNRWATMYVEFGEDGKVSNLVE